MDKMSDTRRPVRYAQAMMSSGIPSLDAILGGGYPIGSIVLVEEDFNGSFANIMLKHFISEGVVSKNSIYIAGDNVNTNLLKKLPGFVEGSNSLNSDYDNLMDVTDEDLKIAWKYRDLPSTVASSHRPKAQPEHYFDLGTVLNLDMVASRNLTVFELNSIDDGRIYANLLKDLCSFMEENNFYQDQVKFGKHSALRICFQSIGSPVWNFSDDKFSCIQFSKFLYELRATLRSSHATCFITVPTVLLKDASVVNTIERYCDFVLKLDSFANCPQNSNGIFKDYNGLLHIVKTPILTSLSSFSNCSLDIAFKIRRRRFTVEIFHLPPSIHDSASSDVRNQVSCGSAVAADSLF